MESKRISNLERAQQILVALATFSVIFVNYLAASGYINNTTPEAISGKYPTFLTPAGYAFAIWSLIYLGLIGFTVYQFMATEKDNPRLKTIRSLYIVNCAANCAWLYLWHNEWIAASLFVIFIMLGTLVLINAGLRGVDSNSGNWLARIPFGIYFGWITIAAILNFSITLVYLGVKTPDSITVVFAVALIVSAMILGILIRVKLALAVYALTFAWALTAIAVNQSDKTTIFILALTAVVILLIASVAPILRRKNSYR